MDADGLKALFEPFGPVAVKRMFGGAGVYAEGLCFAIEADGEVFASRLLRRRLHAFRLCGER